MSHFLLVGLFSTNISNFDTIFLLFLPVKRENGVEVSKYNCGLHLSPFSPFGFCLKYVQDLILVYKQYC